MLAKLLVFAGLILLVGCEVPPPDDGQANPPDGQASPSDGQASPSDGQASPSDGQASPSDGQASPSDDQVNPSPKVKTNPDPIVQTDTSPGSETDTTSNGKKDTPSDAKKHTTSNGQIETSPDGQTKISPNGETEIAPECEANTAKCETRTLPNGKTITVPKSRRVAMPAKHEGKKRNTVSAGINSFSKKFTLPTGRIVKAMVYDADKNPKSGESPKEFRRPAIPRQENPKTGVWFSVKKSYYSFICSTLRIFPSSVRKFPLKLKSLEERMIGAGPPRSCRNLILTAKYSFENFENLKQTLKEKKIPVVWVIGGPGSGKATLCLEMAKREGFWYISVGDSLRVEVKKDPGSVTARVLQDIMKQGDLLPDIVTLNFLASDMMDRMESSKAVMMGFLIAGTPKSLGTAKLFQKRIKPPDVIIYIKVKDETMKERLLHRNEGRIDDNEETIEKRIQLYHNQLKFVTSNKTFKRKIKAIDGEGENEEVFDRFSDAIHEAITV